MPAVGRQSAGCGAVHLAVGMGLPARAHNQKNAVPLVSTIMAAGTGCPAPTEEVCPTLEGWGHFPKGGGPEQVLAGCPGAGWVHFPGVVSVVPMEAGTGIVLSKGTFQKTQEVCKMPDL